MAFPVVTVEIAFASAPGAASPSWTDVSTYVRSLSTRRGRSRELDRYMAGECELVFGNEDRRFDPTHASGPYFGNVLPMKRVRVTATHDAVSHPIFDGFVDSWEQVYEHPQEALAVVRCTDAFKVLNAAELATSAYAQEVTFDTPSHWWRLGEPQGSSRLLDAVGGRDLTIQGTPLLSEESLAINEADTALSIDSELEGAWSEDGLMLAGGPFTIEVLLRVTTWGGANTILAQLLETSTAAAWVGYILAVDPTSKKVEFEVHKTTGAIGFVDSSIALTTGVTYHVAVVWEAGGGFKLYIDGVDRTGTVSSVASGNFTTGPTTFVFLGGELGGSLGSSSAAVGTYDEVALYTSALSSTRVAAHAAAASTAWRDDTPAARVGRLLDLVAWPAALRDLDTGTSVLQSASLNGSALEHLQKVAESEFGALFVARDGDVTLVARSALVNQASQATFGDAAGEWEYAVLDFDYSDADIRNDVIVSRTGGSSQRVTDATSIAAYLRHTFALEGLLHDDDELSRDAATALLAQYKNPALRVTELRLEPVSSNDDLFTEALERELTEWVTVKRKPQNLGLTITQVAVLEGIEHEIADQEWVTVFRLSPAYTTAFWQLGVAGYSELGQTTTLYY